MKKSTLTLIFLLGIVAFAMVACKPSRDNQLKEISSLESQLFAPNVTTFDQEKATQLIALYDGYIKAFPTDSLSPEFLYKSANMFMNMGDTKNAVDRFNQVYQQYPDHKRAATSLFFMGFVYENNMKDLVKAKESYLLFIEKYPENDLVKDAQLSLKNLGKSPEQIIKEFEEMQRQDSIHKADSIAALKPKKKR